MLQMRYLNMCQTAGVYPHILPRSGRGEFQAEFEHWMKENSTQAMTLLSYPPQVIGVIEYFNSQLRKMLRVLMIHHTRLIWYNRLDLCCNYKNKQKTQQKINEQLIN